MELIQSHRDVDIIPSAIRYAGLSKVIKRLGYEVNNFIFFVHKDKEFITKTVKTKLFFGFLSYI